jgi:hypothetical protein
MTTTLTYQGSRIRIRGCGFRRKSATDSDLMSAGDSGMKSAIPI